MESGKRFVLGGAVLSSDLEHYAAWFLEGNRDIEIQDAFDPRVLDDKDEQARWAEIVNTLLDGHTGRRGVHGPFMGIVIGSPDQMVQQVAATRLIQGIEFAAMIGGSHMVVYSPFDGWVNPFSFEGNTNEIGRAIFGIEATLGQVLPVAEQHGVTLVLENIHDFSSAPILQTMQTLDHPNLRMSLDIGHCQLRVPHGGMPNDAYIRSAATWLEHLHIQDNDSLSDRHWAPGEGSINFHAIFEALRETDISPRMILELRDKSALQRANQFLIERGFAAEVSQPALVV